jgi:hypothetical protein
MPQFGSQSGSLGSFSQNFREALLDVLAVYPGARVDLHHGGIELHPGPAAVGRTVVALPGLKVIEGGAAAALRNGHEE